MMVFPTRNKHLALKKKDHIVGREEKRKWLMENHRGKPIRIRKEQATTQCNERISNVVDKNLTPRLIHC